MTKKKTYNHFWLINEYDNDGEKKKKNERLIEYTYYCVQVIAFSLFLLIQCVIYFFHSVCSLISLVLAGM